MSYFTSKYYILGLAYAIFENHCTLVHMHPAGYSKLAGAVCEAVQKWLLGHKRKSNEEQGEAEKQMEMGGGEGRQKGGKGARGKGAGDKGKGRGKGNDY